MNNDNNKPKEGTWKHGYGHCVLVEEGHLRLITEVAKAFMSEEAKPTTWNDTSTQTKGSTTIDADTQTNATTAVDVDTQTDIATTVVVDTQVVF